MCRVLAQDFILISYLEVQSIILLYNGRTLFDWEKGSSTYTALSHPAYIPIAAGALWHIRCMHLRPVMSVIKVKRSVERPVVANSTF